MDNFVDLFMVSPLLLVVLFFVAMLAGFIDALAGGGGLLTVPALLAAGMSPAQALATNKLQACGGSLGIALFYPPQGGESGRSEAQYPDDLYRLHVGRAAGSARAVRYFAPDPADSGYLYRPLLFADAATR
jgi:hypothetical protein